MARRTRTPKPLTAEALPLDPPAWSLSLDAFRSRLPDLTLIKLHLSPFCSNDMESYLIAGEIACLGMAYPLHITLDRSDEYRFETLPWKAGIPDPESKANWEETQRRRTRAGKEAISQASERFTLYAPYLGRPIKDALDEPTRHGPELPQCLEPGSSVQWHTEYVWQSMVARAIKAGEPVPQENRAYIWAHAPHLLEAPKGQRPSQRTKAGPPEPLTPMPQPGEIRFVGMDETLAALAEATHGAETVEYLGVQMNRGPCTRTFRRVRMPETVEAIRHLLKDYEAIVERWNREHPKAAPDAAGRPLNWCIAAERWAQDFEAGGWVKILTRHEPTETTRSTTAAEARAIAELAEAEPSAPMPDPEPLPEALTRNAKPVRGQALQLGFDL